MSKTNPKIQKIIYACGGVRKVAEATGLTDSAVAKWRTIGIQDRYWSILTGLSGLGVMDIYRANEDLRNTPPEE